MGILSPFKLIQALSAPIQSGIRERIGSVTTPEPLTVLFDGEVAGNEQVVTQLGSCFPRVGNRVVCIKIGAAWCAVSVIGPQVWTITKPLDETVGNSTVLQPDNDFHFEMEASARYHWSIRFIVLSSAVADFKMNFTGSATYGASVIWGPRDNFAATPYTFTATASLSITDGTAHPMFVEGWCLNTGTPGTFNFNWAKANAEVSNTIIQSGGCMVVTKCA